MNFKAPIDKPDEQKYSDGDKLYGVLPSVVPPSMINDIIRELITVIANAGIVPSENSCDQLYKAIQSYIATNESVNFLTSNIRDLANYANVPLNLKNATQLRTILSAFNKRYLPIANEIEPGCVSIGTGLRANGNGLLSVAPMEVHKVIRDVGVYSIDIPTVAKPCYLIQAGSSNTGYVRCSIISGVLHYSDSIYKLGTDTTNMLMLVPTETRISVNVSVCVDSSLFLYQ